MAQAAPKGRLSVGNPAKVEAAIKNFNAAKVNHQRKLDRLMVDWASQQFGAEIAPHLKSLKSKCKELSDKREVDQDLKDEAQKLCDEWAAVPYTDWSLETVVPQHRAGIASG